MAHAIGAAPQFIRLDDTSSNEVLSLEHLVGAAESQGATLPLDRALRLIRGTTKQSLWAEIRDRQSNDRMYFFNVITKEVSTIHPVARKGSIMKAHKLVSLKKRSADSNGGNVSPSADLPQHSSPPDSPSISRDSSFNLSSPSQPSVSATSTEGLNLTLPRSRSGSMITRQESLGRMTGTQTNELNEDIVLPFGAAPSETDASWAARRLLETIILRSEVESEILKALEAALSENAAAIEQLLATPKPEPQAQLPVIEDAVVVQHQSVPEERPPVQSTPVVPVETSPANDVTLDVPVETEDMTPASPAPGADKYSSTQEKQQQQSSSQPSTPSDGGSSTPTKPRKSKEAGAVIQVADAFRALIKKHPPEQQKTTSPFTVKDKFCIIHLAYLTQNLDNNIPKIVTDPNVIAAAVAAAASNPGDGSSPAVPDVVTNVYAAAPDTKALESDLKAYLPLRSAFRGDLDDLKIALEQTQDECAKIVLPSTGLTMLHLAICSGRADMIRFIVDKFPDQINKAASNHLTPLMLACLFGLPDVVELLLERKADHNVLCGAIPYAKAGSSIRLAVDYWCSCIPKDRYKLGSINAMLAAVFSGDLQTTQHVVLLSNINVKTTYSKQLFTDALTLAILLNNTKIVKYLVDLGMGVNALDSTGMTALMLLAQTRGSGGVVEQLCQLGANINAVDVRSGNTCLHHAILSGNVEFIKQLCKAKKGSEELAICVNHNNPRQQSTPLQLVLKQSHLSDEKKQKMMAVLKKFGAMERRMYSEVLHEGFITKEGHSVKSWKTRWFVLKESGGDATLSYYKQINSLKDPKGVISLKGATITDEQDHKKKHCFSIWDAVNQKRYYCCCANQHEKQEWLEILVHTVANLKIGRQVAVAAAADAQRGQNS